MNHEISLSPAPLITLDAAEYDLNKTFDCGQCFRFERVAGSPYVCEYAGVAYGRYVRFADDGQGHILVRGVPACEADFWRHYLALDVDYAEVRRQILQDFEGSTVMKQAVALAGGIRILAQERFEILCSFILSQNNNIPRIKKLVEALCKAYGEPIQTPDGLRYAFPTPARLAAVPVHELLALRMGYRARYIADAAGQVACGKIDLEKLTSENAREVLHGICGVGEKVSACIRLFGIGDLSAFPVDVWILRANAQYFGGRLNVDKTGKYGGVAQQYLFYYGRYAMQNKE